MQKILERRQHPCTSHNTQRYGECLLKLKSFTFNSILRCTPIQLSTMNFQRPINIIAPNHSKYNCLPSHPRAPGYKKEEVRPTRTSHRSTHNPCQLLSTVWASMMRMFLDPPKRQLLYHEHNLSTQLAVSSHDSIEIQHSFEAAPESSPK